MYVQTKTCYVKIADENKKTRAECSALLENESICTARKHILKIRTSKNIHIDEHIDEQIAHIDKHILMMLMNK